MGTSAVAGLLTYYFAPGSDRYIRSVSISAAACWRRLG
jgi:hypothetical protein